MANCQNSNERLFGGAVVLEVADGCSDVVPVESEWMALAAGTSKTFDFNPNATTSDADDGGGYVESIITNADFTISFEGEVRKKDKLDQYGVGKFIKYFVTELAAKRQPGLWVRMEFGPVTFQGYMVITALSSDGGTNDITTFSTEFKVGDASTIQAYDTPEDVAVTGVTVAPSTASVAVGATTQLAATIAPSDATNPAVTWSSSNSAIATVSSTGLAAGVEEGEATITATTADGGFTSTSVVTVTAA
ncbi:phage tail tube protein [Pantoea sp.]|uniref:phage tail tube protein n=1 Tax=Pantoea sp. TaxID=69393 RepID=UPI0028AC3717|nr:Ig-like domain-containing protein [Pantoea sp.]